VIEITVELTEYEARALRNNSNLVHAVLSEGAIDSFNPPPPDGHEAHPALTGALKLDLALMAAGAPA
jgi:cell division septal protein FtsQ